MTDLIDEHQPENSSSKTQKEIKRRRAITILIVIFLTSAVLYLLYWLIWGRFSVYTNDAYVHGNIVALMPQVSSTVIAINTEDTHLVKQGQTLVQLDPTDFQIALQHAEANLAKTVRQVRQNFENASRAQQLLKLQEADLKQAQLDLKRRRGLVKELAISHEELQHYKTALVTANANYQSTRHQLDALLAVVENTHVHTHPWVEEAKAVFRKAYLDLKRTAIIAPTTGFIAKRSVQIGQQVNPGTSLLAIVPLNETWVEANYKESQISSLRIGQSVILSADAYSDMTYHGKVAGLNVGTGAAFALLPPQNATGNWIKIVQRLPVRITLDQKELIKNPLLIGLTMGVTTNVRDQSGKRLAKIARNETLFATNVYEKELPIAEAKIDKILKDNAPNLYFPLSNHNEPKI